VKWMIPLLALAVLVWYTSRRPVWVDDLLLRAYARDHVADGRKDPVAAEVSGEYGVPLKWVYTLQAKGVPHDKLGDYTNAVVEEIIRLGPPSDMRTDTLNSYRDTVLNTVVSG
jgi:hypothetical protein